MTAKQAFTSLELGLPDFTAGVNKELKAGSVQPVHPNIAAKAKGKYLEFLNRWKLISDKAVSRTRGGAHGDKVNEITKGAFARFKETGQAINKALENTPYNLSWYIKSDDSAGQRKAATA